MSLRISNRKTTYTQILEARNSIGPGESFTVQLQTGKGIESLLDDSLYCYVTPRYSESLLTAGEAQSKRNRLLVPCSESLLVYVDEMTLGNAKLAHCTTQQGRSIYTGFMEDFKPSGPGSSHWESLDFPQQIISDNASITSAAVGKSVSGKELVDKNFASYSKLINKQLQRAGKYYSIDAVGDVSGPANFLNDAPIAMQVQDGNQFHYIRIPLRKLVMEFVSLGMLDLATLGSDVLSIKFTTAQARSVLQCVPPVDADGTFTDFYVRDDDSYRIFGLHLNRHIVELGADSQMISYPRPFLTFSHTSQPVIAQTNTIPVVIPPNTLGMIMCFTINQGIQVGGLPKQPEYITNDMSFTCVHSQYQDKYWFNYDQFQLTMGQEMVFPTGKLSDTKYFMQHLFHRQNLSMIMSGMTYDVSMNEFITNRGLYAIPLAEASGTLPQAYNGHVLFKFADHEVAKVNRPITNFTANIFFIHRLSIRKGEAGFTTEI